MLHHPEDTIQLPEGISALISAEAEDERGIRNVSFYINGELINVDYEEPYEFIYFLPLVEEDCLYRFGAQAFDMAA